MKTSTRSSEPRRRSDRIRVPKPFVNDLILAASWREAGLTLITENTRDFIRIQQVLPLKSVEPWPG